jgi:hypothetical protein
MKASPTSEERFAPVLLRRFATAVDFDRVLELAFARPLDFTVAFFAT